MLIFDEATSALDNGTQAIVAESSGGAAAVHHSLCRSNLRHREGTRGAAGKLSRADFAAQPVRATGPPADGVMPVS